MGRPAELADRLHPVEPIAAVDERPGVAGEGRGVARDIGDTRHIGGGEQRRLLLRAGAGRIEDDGVEAIELLLRRAGGGRGRDDRRTGPARPPSAPARRPARLPPHRPCRRAPARRCRARRTDRRRSRASPTASRTASTRAASPSAVACRKAPCGNGTGTPLRLDRHRLGLPDRLRRRSRRRAPAAPAPAPRRRRSALRLPPAPRR